MTKLDNLYSELRQEVGGSTMDIVDDIVALEKMKIVRKVMEARGMEYGGEEDSTPEAIIDTVLKIIR